MLTKRIGESVPVNANTTILRSRSARVALYLTFATMGATAATVPATIPVVSGLGSGELDAYLRAVPALFFGLLIGVLVSSAAGGWLAPRTFLQAPRCNCSGSLRSR